VEVACCAKCSLAFDGRSARVTAVTQKIQLNQFNNQLAVFPGFLLCPWDITCQFSSLASIVGHLLLLILLVKLEKAGVIVIFPLLLEYLCSAQC